MSPSALCVKPNADGEMLSQKNVLVGHEDNVWLVDLVDGFMPGWVDENKQGTATGDVEALHQIRQWLERLRAD
jgi:hypothetical protein